MTGETPDASKQMNVHVYGALFADESINVNSNCFINYDGVIEANAYKGDGGLLSNVRSTFQSITENGPWPAGAATDLTVTFANVSTGAMINANLVVDGFYFGDGQHLSNIANLSIFQSNVDALNTNISSNVSELRPDNQANVDALNTNK